MCIPFLIGEVGLFTGLLMGLVILLISSLKIVLFLLCILLVVSVLYLFRQPRFLFEIRLNNLFVIRIYPFSKWKNIYQDPVKSMKFRETGLTACKSHYKLYVQELKSVFDFIDGGHGYYRTITHVTLKNRLEAMQEQGKIQILKCQPAYKQSLAHLQKKLLHKQCKKCPDSNRCQFRKKSKQKRQFYYIEFCIL